MDGEKSKYKEAVPGSRRCAPCFIEGSECHNAKHNKNTVDNRKGQLDIHAIVV